MVLILADLVSVSKTSECPHCGGLHGDIFTMNSMRKTIAVEYIGA